MRAFEFVNSEPWLITDEALETIVSIVERTNDLDALSTRMGRPLMNARRVQVRDAVAVIPVTGPVVRYANLFSEVSGATSTEILARDIRTALDDPLIEALVLEMNSPGGMATGINELGDMIFQGREMKPIIAYGDGQMASAAYLLASAADEIVIDRTAILGSIGAKMTLQDTSGRDARAGVRTLEIVSSQSPDKTIDPNMEEGRAKLQRIVDDLAGVFVEAVARNRDVTVQTVLSDFGRGGMMVGQAAVDAGLADRIGSLESVIAELSPRTLTRTRSISMSTRKPSAPLGPVTVSNTTALRAALDAGHTPEEITVLEVDIEKIKTEAVAAAQADWQAKQTAAIEAATKEAREVAVKAERDRIVGLQAISMKGFEKEVAAAIESGATVEATAVQITKLARERGVTVDSLKAGAPAAVRHGGAAPETTAEGSKWGSITSRFKKQK